MRRIHWNGERENFIESSPSPPYDGGWSVVIGHCWLVIVDWHFGDWWLVVGGWSSLFPSLTWLRLDISKESPATAFEVNICLANTKLLLSVHHLYDLCHCYLDFHLITQISGHIAQQYSNHHDVPCAVRNQDSGWESQKKELMMQMQVVWKMSSKC